MTPTFYALALVDAAVFLAMAALKMWHFRIWTLEGITSASESQPLQFVAIVVELALGLGLLSPTYRIRAAWGTACFGGATLLANALRHGIDFEACRCLGPIAIGTAGRAALSASLLAMGVSVALLGMRCSKARGPAGNP